MSAAAKQFHSHALDLVDDAYVVGHLSSFDSLPFWGRMFVKYVCLPLERYAYRKWKWSCNPHGQTIYKTVAAAEKRCAGKPRWFWLKLPVERELPEEVFPYGHSFPASPARGMYEEAVAPMAAIVNDDLLKETRERAARLAGRRI